MRQGYEWTAYVGAPLVSLGIIFCLVKTSGINVSYADIKDYGGALLNVSGSVFTIMGIWVAYLYPDALVRITSRNVSSGDFSEARENSSRLKTMVGSIIISALVAVAVVYVFLGKTLFSSTIFYHDNRAEIKSFAISIIILATAFQTISIFYVIRSNFLFLVEFHEKRVKHEKEDDV